ncbi:hypothetical protein CCACVL1_29795, partial [Corchorus capsularis]
MDPSEFIKQGIKDANSEDGACQTRDH